MTVQVAKLLNFCNEEVQTIQLLESILPLARGKYAQLPFLKAEDLRGSMKEKDEMNIDTYLPDLLQTLGEAYRKTSSWDKATQVLKEANSIFEPLTENLKTYDNSEKTDTAYVQLNRHMALQLALSNKRSNIMSLIDLLLDQSRFDEALDLVNQQIKSLKKDKPNFKLFYEKKLQILNRKFDFKGYKQTIELARRDNISIGDTLNWSELLFSGRFEEVMKLNEVNKLKYKNLFGEASEFYIICLEMHSSSLMILGNYEASKRVLDSAYLLAQNKDISQDTRIGILGSYAFLEQRMGQNELALKYQRDCFNAKKIQLHPLSKDMAKEWSSLADSYLANQMLDCTAYCLNQALSIYEKALGTKHFDYNNVLKQLIQVLYDKKQYAEAEIRTKEMLENGKNYFDLMPMVALAQYNSVIPIFLANGKTQEAKTYQLKAAELFNRIFRDSSRLNFLKNQRYALQIADIQANTSEITDYSKIWLSGMKALIGRQIPFLPEGEKTQFIQSLNTEFDAVTSVLTRYTEGLKYLYDLALLQKGIALTDTRGFQRRSWDLPEGETKNSALQLAAQMKLLKSDNIAFDVRIQFNREADSLRTLLKNDKEGKKLFTTDWLETSYTDIQKQLKPNEVAIEFLDFKYQTPTLPTDSVMYYALVLRKEGDPSVIPLFEEKELIRLFDATVVYKHFVRVGLPDSLKIDERETVKNRYNKEYGKKLYDLIWQPLENRGILRGIKTVHFAPSGLLNRINIAALPIVRDSTKRLMEVYQLQQYNTTRSIVETATQRNTSARDLVLMGDIQFGNCEGDSSKTAGLDTYIDTNPLATKSPYFADSTRIKWGYLKSGKAEVEQIARIQKTQQPNAAFTSWTGFDATEARLKSYGSYGKPSPSILYISTHGYGNPSYYPESRYASGPLHRAGLVMATANWTTYCPKQRAPNEDNGLLTAYEISQLNLSNTELVVLNGCQTGLGDIWGREGVFGLTRGFKLAGARYMIASLWEVPEPEANEFMTTFYEAYQSEKNGQKRTIAEAFEQTQKAMLQKQSVYSWGAWVLVE
jgi:CHAT domain-containing protein